MTHVPSHFAMRRIFLILNSNESHMLSEDLSETAERPVSNIFRQIILIRRLKNGKG